MITSLQQLKAGESPKSAIINENFEILRQANNALVERIKKLNHRIKTPSGYNAVIDTLNLFGIVNGVTYDNNILSAERLNENFDKFKIALLYTGGIPNVKAVLDALKTQLASITLPNAPSGLVITGIIIVDNTYLNNFPESGYNIGDRIISLGWVDNANNEVDFEIYMPRIEIVNSSLTRLWFAPENGGYLTATPIENATSSLINIGQSFLYPLPENMQVPAPFTAVENLTDNNILMPDNTITRGQGVHFAIRAASTDGYSIFANPALTYDNRPYGLSRPYNIETSFNGSSLNVAWTNTANQHITGFEIYVSYAPSEFSTDENFEKYPYTLLYTTAGDINTTSVVIDNCPIPPAEYDNITGARLNKYMLIKVVAYNEIKRSVVGWSDRADVGVCEIPEITTILSITDIPFLYKNYINLQTLEAVDSTMSMMVDTNGTPLPMGGRYGIWKSPIGRMVLSTDTGLYSSTDKGATWAFYKVPPAQFYQICTLRNGDIIAGSDNALYKSIDGGETFGICASFSGFTPRAICVMPNGNIMCCDSNTHQMCFSDDNGITFTNPVYTFRKYITNWGSVAYQSIIIYSLCTLPNGIIYALCSFQGGNSAIFDGTYFQKTQDVISGKYLCVV